MYTTEWHEKDRRRRAKREEGQRDGLKGRKNGERGKKERRRAEERGFVFVRAQCALSLDTGVRMRGNGRENAGRNNRDHVPLRPATTLAIDSDAPRRTRKKLDFNRTFAIELLPGSIATLRSLVSAASQIFVRETREGGAARGKPI